MTETPEKTAAEKLAEALRRKTDAAKGKGGGAPGRGAGETKASLAATQNTKPSVAKRSGSFKGR